SDMHLLSLEDSFQAVQRQMIPQLARNHVGQEARPRQTLFDRLGRPLRHFNLRVVTVVVAMGTSVLVPNVLEDFEASRKIFELFALFLADATPLVAASRTPLVLKIVLNLDSLEMGGQLLAAVPVAVFNL